MTSHDLLSWTDSGFRASTEISHQLFDFLDLKFPPSLKDEGEARFREAVRDAAVAAGGELLFDLPADGLVENRRRIAVARIPADGDGMRVVMATLDRHSARIHLQKPDDRTAHLVGFANAFVGVFQHIGEPQVEAAFPRARSAMGFIAL